MISSIRRLNQNELRVLWRLIPPGVGDGTCDILSSFNLRSVESVNVWYHCIYMSRGLFRLSDFFPATSNFAWCFSKVYKADKCRCIVRYCLVMNMGIGCGSIICEYLSFVLEQPCKWLDPWTLFLWILRVLSLSLKCCVSVPVLWDFHKTQDFDRQCCQSCLKSWLAVFLNIISNVSR